MKPGIVIQRVKDALKLSKDDIVKIYEIEKFDIDKDRVEAILKKSSSKKSLNATYEELGVFLDGLISVLRGIATNPSNDDKEIILDNNLIIKKLKIALNLKSIDIEMIFNLSDYPISKSKIRDIFRSPTHPKYKSCSDDVLDAFLDGLDEFCYDMPDIEIE